MCGHGSVSVRHHPCRSLKEFADAGMMCDWSPQGKIFAAGAQDGRCMVWDARDRRLVARYTVQNAVRSVKFSSSPMDLLAFAEQEGRAHLVDTRMLDKKQASRRWARAHGMLGVDASRDDASGRVLAGAQAASEWGEHAGEHGGRNALCAGRDEARARMRGGYFGVGRRHVDAQDLLGRRTALILLGEPSLGQAGQPASVALAAAQVRVPRGLRKV